MLNRRGDGENDERVNVALMSVTNFHAAARMLQKKDFVQSAAKSP